MADRPLGLSAEDVSIPWHLHGARVWDVIATEGAAAQMVDANGYGMNWEGLYDPELIAHGLEPITEIERRGMLQLGEVDAEFRRVAAHGG